MLSTRRQKITEGADARGVGAEILLADAKPPKASAAV
jgi:hypothetical protein